MNVETGILNQYTPPETDEAARKRILADLETNMLVEAGAGSGKTTSLIGRMYALVARGEPVERIAAVTFTRKTANELRERFQIKLETELSALDRDTDAWQYCDRALRDLNRAFIGTIHSFCARILREHPLDISLDPNFAEVSEGPWKDLCHGFWTRWLESCRRDNDPALGELAAIGVDARLLYEGFTCVMKYQDIDFTLVETERPDGIACRTELESLIARARAMMPTEEPAAGWDGLMDLVKKLEYDRLNNDWSGIAALCAALEKVSHTACKVTQNRWSDTTDGKNAAKSLSGEFETLLENEISALLTCWYEYRYPVVMRFLQRASRAFAVERHESGQLGFEDLLLLSARLLREHPRVRDELGERYRRLLVDEFQDTDPIQAEVCFLLTSESSEGNDWRSVRPRSGGIFLVGDPKQSIYRFRRADIQVYEFAKSRMTECGAVLALTRNFRSAPSIGDFVNGYFQDIFPVSATGVQAAFTPMQTVKEAGVVDGVSEYWVRPEGRDKASIVAMDSKQVASWIAARISSGDRAPGDFLILTERVEFLATYARALAAHNIPVTTSGAKLLQEEELAELVVVLRAIADPDNPIAVVAALEGMCFGCGQADLYEAHVAGLRFRISHPPDAIDSAVTQPLRQLHEWWKLSRHQAADVLVQRILDDSGLLCYAASQTLGDARAGALLRLTEVLREASMSGASGITNAVDRIELLLTQESDDAPLRPGRTDAVRVMNLHKAKGLEATVVILAAPVPAGDFPPRAHITRGEVGTAGGGIVISSDRGTLAQPAGWATMSEAEREFADAEDQRLLYVAATRAKNELIISRCEFPKAKTSKEEKPDTSAWSPFGAALTKLGRRIAMQPTEAPGRRVADRTSLEIMEAVSVARAAVERSATPSFVHRTVTESAKEERQAIGAYDLPLEGGRGKAWGRAVHRCIEAAGHGRTDQALRAFIAAVVSDEKLDVNDAAELETWIVELRQSETWARLTNEGSASFELPVMRFSDDVTSATLTEGVIDAIAPTNDEWLLIDWKTDAVSDDEWVKRSGQYQNQVAAYEQMIEQLSGRSVRSVIQRVRAAEANT